MRYATLGSLLLLLLTGASAQAADTVYKWVDDEGVVHYGTRAPTGEEVTAIKPKTGHSEPVTYNIPTSDSDAEETTANTEQKVTLKDPERCAAAKQNIKALNNFGRVKVKNDDGSYHYLTEEEQQQKIKQAQQAMNEAC